MTNYDSIVLFSIPFFDKYKILYLEAFDGRKKQIYLTEKGRTLVKQTVVHLIEIEKQNWKRKNHLQHHKLK